MDVKVIVFIDLTNSTVRVNRKMIYAADDFESFIYDTRLCIDGRKNNDSTQPTEMRRCEERKKKFLKSSWMINDQ
jgi:hypothetical protein